MHTTKTFSYYTSCFTIFVALVVFLAFNIWQLSIALRAQNYLGESLATSSNSVSGSIDSCSGFLHHGTSFKRTATPPLSKSRPSCKVLNKPPLVIDKVFKSGTLDGNFGVNGRLTKVER